MKHVYQMTTLLVIVLLVIVAAVVPAIAQSPTKTSSPVVQAIGTKTATPTLATPSRTPTPMPICIPAVSIGNPIPFTATPTTFKFSTLAYTATVYPTGATFTIPTASATPFAVIQTTKVEILFPAAIRFEADLGIGKKDLKSATLHISQPEAKIDIKQDIDLDHELIFISDNAALLSHAWQFDPTTAPLVFGIVNYDWTVVGNDGTTTTSSGKFSFQDLFTAPDPWCMTENGSVRLYSQTPGLSLDWAQRDIANVQQRVVTDTGVKHNLNAVVYKSGITFCTPDKNHPGQYTIQSQLVNLTLPCDPTAGPRIYQTQGYSIIQASSNAAALRDEVTGAIVADAYDTYWQKNQVTVPAWFRGGLVHLYDVWPHLDYLGVVLNARQNNQLLGLSDLQNPPTDKNTALWNAESYTLVLYLNSKYGPQATTELAASLTSSGPKFEDALSKITGGNIDSLFSAWQNWLPSDDAKAAAGVTFYTPPTSTPQSSDTVEPASTGTATPEASAASSGTESATAAATASAS